MDMLDKEFKAGQQLAGFIEGELDLTKEQLIEYIVDFIPECTNLQIIAEVENIKMARQRHLNGKDKRNS